MPEDPVILLSFVNTQLRDNYSSLEDLCRSYDVSQEKLTEALAAINYHYSDERRQFI